MRWFAINNKRITFQLLTPNKKSFLALPLFIGLFNDYSKHNNLRRKLRKFWEFFKVRVPFFQESVFPFLGFVHVIKH